MTNPENRPVPFMTDLTRPFWTSGADGQLRVQQCTDCMLWLHPPTTVCRRCLSTALSFNVVSGAGTLTSFTVNYQQWYPGPAIPYIVGLVELDEQPGLRLTTNIVNCAIESLSFDARVRVCFEPLEDVYLPLFMMEND